MVASRITSLNSALRPMDEDELLNHYLSVPPDERRVLFASTSRAAGNFGISQRTLQLWIEHGLLFAIRVGRNYQVYLPDLERYIAACSGASVPEKCMRNLRISRK